MPRAFARDRRSRGEKKRGGTLLVAGAVCNTGSAWMLAALDVPAIPSTIVGHSAHGRSCPIPSISSISAPGIDKDGDGLIDFPNDPGCLDAAALKESPRCDDGLDNDKYGAIDWNGGPLAGPPDPQCVGTPWKDVEGESARGLGAELTLVPLLAFAASRRRRAN